MTSPLRGICVSVAVISVSNTTTTRSAAVVRRPAGTLSCASCRYRSVASKSHGRTPFGYERVLDEAGQRRRPVVQAFALFLAHQAPRVGAHARALEPGPQRLGDRLGLRLGGPGGGQERIVGVVVARGLEAG